MEEPVNFSIIIPTYNRLKQLKRCLEALTRIESGGGTFEVIIVDDGSLSPPDQIIRCFRERLNISLLTQANSGPAGARNRGALVAKGQFLVFTDDDCEPSTRWLVNLEKELSQFPYAMIGGKTVNILSKNMFSSASQILISFLYEYHNRDPENGYFIASNNMALSKELFHIVGGFNSSFPYAAGEDREFCDRWHHHKYRIRYSRSSVVHHVHDLSFGSFVRQHFTYGRAALYFHRLRRKRGLRVRCEPLTTFYFQLLLYPIRQHHIEKRLIIFLLLFISQTVNVIGYFYEVLATKEN